MASRHPVAELARLLSPKRAIRGTVLSIDGEQARVRTRTGTQIANIQEGAIVQVGQEVRLSGGVIVGRVRAEDDLPVYPL